MRRISKTVTIDGAGVTSLLSEIVTRKLWVEKAWKRPQFYVTWSYFVIIVVLASIYLWNHDWTGFISETDPMKSCVWIAASSLFEFWFLSFANEIVNKNGLLMTTLVVSDFPARLAISIAVAAAALIPSFETFIIAACLTCLKYKYMIIW